LRKAKKPTVHIKRIIIFSLLPAILLVTGIFYTTTQLRVSALTNTYTFPAAADAYVYESSPTLNFGTNASIGVDASPIKRSYLRFNVLNVSGTITKATLKVYANSAQKTGYEVHAVSDNSWLENTITYNIAPAFSNVITGSSGPIIANTWTMVDVTSLVQTNGPVSMALLTTDSTNVNLASNNSANSPQLIVEASSVVATPTPTDSGLPISTIVPFPTATPVPTLIPTDTPLPTPIPTIAPTPTPTLAPTATGNSLDPTIVASGDIACGAGSTGAACGQVKTANLVLAANPNAVLLLGDNQYEQGAFSDFQNYYDKSWGLFKNITYPAVGNHEYLTANASGYFDYFNGVGNQNGPAGARNQGYYAFNVGTWRLYALNSTCSGAGGCQAGSPQEKWLRADLAANPHQCVLAYFHAPLYTSGSRFQTSVRPLYQALYDYNADVILNGHEHNYERFAPQDANTHLDPIRGITEFVVGTGGRNFTTFVTNAANSLAKNDNTFGILKMTLHPSSYDFQFVPVAGSTYTDAGTNQLCH
jgi:acid phosphatase type 7